MTFPHVVFVPPTCTCMNEEWKMKLNTQQTLAGKDFSTSFLTLLKRYGSSSLCKDERLLASPSPYSLCSASKSSQLENLK